MKSAQHRPFLIPIWLTFGAFGLAFLFAVFLLWVLVTADATTVIVIVAPDDSPAGQARAAVLARMFGPPKGPAHLDAIYLGVPKVSVDEFPPLKTFPTTFASEAPKDLARRVLHEHSGGRVLIVSDSASQPAIVAALSGRWARVAGDVDPAALYVVTVPRIGHSNVLRLSY
ncbi:MAG TPA: hypothetical protein VGI93_18055 [Steroidobacteraceae bacterium]|jgi:hypothetical protein